MSEGARWDRVEELFHAATELDAAAAAEYLEAECEDDAPLRREVETLLESARSSGDFLETFARRVLSGNGEETRADAALRARFDPMVGTTVRHYEVRDPIGSGGMGHVYAGFDTHLQRGVALKVLPPVDRDSEDYQRFFVEGRAAAALDHENIGAIHEIGETEEGRPYLVMPLYEGCNLRERLEHGPLPLSTALDYGIQVCRGLSAAHAAGIIHRDVKPANLFLTDSGCIKLLDFGLAKLSDVSLTGTRRAMGTLSYMSPEQTTGGRVDSRTDIWSLGVALYEMLTGSRPFEGKTAAAVIEGVVHGAPTPLREIDAALPERLERVLLATLAKDREDRTGTVEELQAELEACQS